MHIAFHWQGSVSTLKTFKTFLVYCNNKGSEIQDLLFIFQANARCLPDIKWEKKVLSIWLKKPIISSPLLFKWVKFKMECSSWYFYRPEQAEVASQSWDSAVFTTQDKSVSNKIKTDSQGSILKSNSDWKNCKISDTFRL